MTTIRQRAAEYPVAQGITRADVMAASDRRALLAAGDALAFAADFHDQTPQGRRRLCLPGCIACDALARWREVAGER